jgi:HEAT repeat protein
MRRVMLREPFGRAAGLVAALALVSACGADIRSSVPERRAAAVRRAAKGDDLSVLLVAQRDPSAMVRHAAADALAGRPGGPSADALGALLADPDLEVAAAAARGLAAMPSEPRAKQALVDGYALASPGGRAAIADALAAIGTSLREAVEAEARRIHDRDVVVLQSGRPAERAGAAEELGASGRHDAVQRLLPLLDPNRNQDPALIAAAARGLGEAGDWAARTHLETLLGDADASVAEAAAEALGRLGDPAAADALAAAAAGGTGRLAAVAADALAALPQASDVGVALCELAARSVDPRVAARAARQARLRDGECPARLFLARLTRPGQETAALAALGELGLRGDLAAAAGPRVAAMLEARADPAIRAAAARALAQMGWAGAAPVVARRAAAVVQRAQEARARWIAGRFGGTATPAFEAGGDARLAATLTRPASAALGPVAADAPSTPPWIDRFSEADAEELGALAAAAGALRCEGAAALLAALAKDPAPAVRAGAVAGIAARGGDAALGELARMLGDAAPSVRSAAAAALAQFGARAVPPLAEAVDRASADDAEGRIALARALGEAGVPEAVPALVKLLSGPSAAAAAAALGRTGAATAARPLADVLADPASPARADAIEALSQFAAPEAGPAIAAQLTSDRPELRAAAARGLGRLRYEPASPRLEALRSDYDGRVRRAAVEALAKLPSGAPASR